MIRLRTVLAAAALIVSYALAAFAAPQGDLARVRQSGKLVMLSAPHQESAFVKTNLEAGPMKKAGTAADFIGVDVDLMAAFAKKLGVELEIRPAFGPDGLPGYGHLVPALLDGKGDLVASSFSITPQRQEKIDFSKPYFSVYPAIVARADSGIESAASLEGKRACTIAGSSQESHLLAFGFKAENILYVDFQFENYAAVMEGEADFTIQDSSSAARMVRQYPELRVVGPLMDTRDSYGFGVRKGSDLKAELDRFIDEIRADGRLDRLLAERHLSLAD
jgi:ABC-type amino acid transport substrate-binding protein